MTALLGIRRLAPRRVAGSRLFCAPAGDPFKVLGVSPNATPEEISKAYREAAHKYHPDKNPGDPQAAARFREIAAAFDSLKDPAARRETQWVREYGRGGTSRRYAPPNAQAQPESFVALFGFAAFFGFLHLNFAQPVGISSYKAPVDAAPGAGKAWA
mmetsp:Transcript_83628/g.223671  ORF Transcript_83628/g.223671 Transcript_83628/m.223671 type:complete len:157 (+) Transcript_83628:12-482(+)